MAAEGQRAGQTRAQVEYLKRCLVAVVGLTVVGVSHEIDIFVLLGSVVYAGEHKVVLGGRYGEVSRRNVGAQLFLNMGYGVSRNQTAFVVSLAYEIIFV